MKIISALIALLMTPLSQSAQGVSIKPEQLTQESSPETATEPNILFILIDDFGWKDVGYNGSTFYDTPEIDNLSEQWMRFGNCYVPSPMCSPTHVSILTGKNRSLTTPGRY